MNSIEKLNMLHLK